jgi:energy-coupling factor transporter transmembrane protein EcfT
MLLTHRKCFSQEYDGVSYRQIYRLDPRLLIPGTMLILLSVPLLIWTWPIVTPLAITVIGVALAACAFLKRHYFSVSPNEYVVSWSIGPIGWTTTAGADEIEPILAGGRRGTYSVLLRRGLRTLDPLIHTGSRREGKAWCKFLKQVSAGESAIMPDEDTAWPFQDEA